MREINSFKKGIHDGLPICFGYLSVAFAFGIFAVASGLTPPQAIIISMTNVTSAGQLAAVPILAGGGTLAELALTQLVINLRYSLMSVSLSQRLGKSVRPADRFAIAFVNTDEVFAVATAQPAAVGRRYLYGLIITPWLGWSIGTAIGALAGDILPAVVTTALGIAIYGMFIAIVLPAAKKDRATAACVLLAVALSCLFKFIPALSAVPGGFVVIICAGVASAVMAIVCPVDAENTHEEGGHDRE